MSAIETYSEKGCGMIRLTHAILLASSVYLSAGAALAQDISGRAVTTETFESWILTCVTTADRQACEINQNIADASGTPLMQLQVGTFNNSGPEHTMLARFPVNITTTMPIIWSADDISVSLTLRACFNNFCAADGRISEDVARALLQADPQATTRFTMTRADGATASVPLSLTGFSEAWTAMVERTR